MERIKVLGDWNIYKQSSGYNSPAANTGSDASCVEISKDEDGEFWVSPFGRQGGLDWEGDNIGPFETLTEAEMEAKDLLSN